MSTNACEKRLKTNVLFWHNSSLCQLRIAYIVRLNKFAKMY